MLARIWSALLVGIDALKVGVEVDLSGGLPSVVVVGLPDTAVQESRERVRAALKNAGFAFPMRKVVINLTPADVRKEGPIYDLPIAVGTLLALDGMSQRRFCKKIIKTADKRFAEHLSRLRGDA